MRFVLAPGACLLAIAPALAGAQAPVASVAPVAGPAIDPSPLPMRDPGGGATELAHVPGAAGGAQALEQGGQDQASYDGGQ